ncbi:MAG TPA: hypothetical protein VFI90_04980 [Rubrobacter sp.]|nr:hypothetical protein [Rubrobacter sp.]
MTTQDPGAPNLPRLLSVPGLAAIAFLGISVIVVSRLFGPENVLKEVVTELLASFGSTILLLAIFGLFFRTGLQRLIRGAPGGVAFAESVDHLRELLDQQGREKEGEKLDRIAEDVRSLAADELPRLEKEIQELRRMIADPEYGRDG